MANRGNNSKKSNGSMKASNGHSTEPVKNSQLEKFFHDTLKDIYWAENT